MYEVSDLKCNCSTIHEDRSAILRSHTRFHFISFRLMYSVSIVQYQYQYQYLVRSRPDAELSSGRWTLDSGLVEEAILRLRLGLRWIVDSAALD